jgi:2'-5' RNA ligase
MLYFVAILTPDDINRQALEWKNYMLQQFNCKVALKSPAHITLIPPFHMPDSDQSDMADILNRVALQHNPFSIQLKNFAAFKPRVIYIDVQPNPLLNELKAKTEEALLQANRFKIKKEERPFHPHITIANRDLEKEDFQQAWQHFQPISYETSFTADAISLLQNNDRKWNVTASFKLGGYKS